MEWVLNKIGDDDPWSARNISPFLNRDSLAAMPSCFPLLTIPVCWLLSAAGVPNHLLQVKMKLVLSILSLSQSVQLDVQQEIEALLDVALRDRFLFHLNWPPNIHCTVTNG
jgi:hypothetical protein